MRLLDRVLMTMGLSPPHWQRVIPHHDLVTLRYLTADDDFGKVKYIDGVHHRSLAVLFSTDLDLDSITLYRYYVTRFQIECLFRDSPQFTGLTHCQARDNAALTFHTHASLTAVSFNTLQAVQTFGQLPVPFSRASLVRRCFNEYLLKKMLACLAEGRRLAEKSPDYETLCNHGILHPVAA